MRVQADDSCLTVAQVLTKPLDLVRVNIWGRDFDGDRQIQDNLVLRCRLPDIDDRFADLKSKIDLG